MGLAGVGRRICEGKVRAGSLEEEMAREEDRSRALEEGARETLPVLLGKRGIFLGRWVRRRSERAAIAQVPRTRLDWAAEVRRLRSRKDGLRVDRVMRGRSARICAL